MDRSDIKVQYSPIHAVISDDFGCCYYCGCEADKQDYVPPIKHYSFYRQRMDALRCMIVPACKECRDFLVDCEEGEIDKRFDYVKSRISKKYRRALSIYSAWMEDDSLEEMSPSLKKSIQAGMSLGKESDERLRYKGFRFDFDGIVIASRIEEKKIYDIYGEKFEVLRDALLYGAKNYRININELKARVMDNGGDINQAITDYHEELERQLFDRRKKKLCREFAAQHKQNHAFILRTVEHYLEALNTKNIEACLDKIYRERIRKQCK